MDTYTVPLDFNGELIRHFPGAIKYNKSIRCTVPLTIKRAPSRCGWVGGAFASPGRTIGLGSLGRSSFLEERGARKERATFGTVKSLPKRDKENCNFSTEEVYKLLERKAAELVDIATSPTRLNDPLSLARFHDALAAQRPSAEFCNVEVHTVHTTLPRGSPLRSPLAHIAENRWSTLERLAEKPAKRPSLFPSLRRLPPAGHDQDDKEGTTSESSLWGSPWRKAKRQAARRDGSADITEDCVGESLKVASQKEAAARHGPVDCTEDCADEPSKAALGRQQAALHGPIDGTEDCSAPDFRSAEREARHAVAISLDRSLDHLPQIWKDSLYRGPMTTFDEPTLEEQKRAIEKRMGKQAELYKYQLERAERFGRGLDAEAIFAGDARADEMEPQDLSVRDCEAKLREHEARRAEIMEAIDAGELQEVKARVKEAEEMKSLGLKGESYAPGLANQSASFDVERWQKTIQANDRELNWRARGNGVKDGQDRERGDEDRLMLEATVLDAADSEEDSFGAADSSIDEDK